VLGSDLFCEFLPFLASGLVSHLCSDLFGDFLEPCLRFNFIEGPNVPANSSACFVGSDEYALASEPSDLVVAPSGEFGRPCHVSNRASV
jgi:hypothetical protein